MDVFAAISARAAGNAPLLTPRPASRFAAPVPAELPPENGAEPFVPRAQVRVVSPLEPRAAAGVEAARGEPAPEPAPSPVRQSAPQQTPSHIAAEPMLVATRISVQNEQGPEPRGVEVQQSPLDRQVPDLEWVRESAAPLLQPVFTRSEPSDRSVAQQPPHAEEVQQAQRAAPAAQRTEAAPLTTREPLRAPTPVVPVLLQVEREVQTPIAPMLVAHGPMSVRRLAPHATTPATRASAAAAAEAAAAPVIEVTIGRVEVRAVTPPAPAPRVSHKPATSLDAYLSRKPGAGG